MKNRIKKLRKITVDGQEYKYLIEGSRKERTISIWKNKVSFLVRDFRLTEITPSFIEELIREKNKTNAD